MRPRIPHISAIAFALVSSLLLLPFTGWAGHFVNQYTDQWGYTYHLEAPDDWDGGIYDPLTDSWTTPWYPQSAVITSVTPPSPEPFPDSIGRGISVPQRVSWLRNSGEDPDESMDVPLTGIGAGAFQGIQGLVRAELPQTCTWVGDNGFRDCSNLTIVSIPDECVSLGSYAFASCTNLVNVDLGNGLQRVGGSAFSGCSSLLEILFPDSLVSIGEATLNGCSALELVSVPFTGKSRDNALESREKNFAFIFGTASFTGSYDASNSHFTLFGNLVRYQLPTALTTVIISASDRIHDYAFQNCSYITSIAINNGVASIGDYAFYACSRLSSITIPDSVTSIGEEAFRGCSGLTSITIPDSVTSIGRIAFYYCTGLTSVRIPNCITNMGSSAFQYCSGLTSITIPDGVTSIGVGAFSHCSGLTSVTIPDSVTNIGGGAFSGCFGLTSVTIPDSVTSIGDSAFSGCSRLTSITIPDSVTNIPAKAFYNCSGLSDVSIGNGVKCIEKEAFYNCTNLTVLSLGISLDNIHGDAFSRCTNIAEIHIPDILSWCQISWGSSSWHPLQRAASLIVGNDSILERKNLSLDLQGAGKIGGYGLAFLTNLVSVTLPETMVEIGKHAFDGCQSLATINVNVPDVSVWCTNGMNTLLSATRRLWANGQSIYSLSIPDGVTCIGESAFSGFEFGKVTIPDSVTVIEKDAFRGSLLGSIMIGDKVESIGQSAFSGCYRLKSITIPNSVTNIGNYAFSGCSGLQTLCLPVRFKDITSSMSIPSGCSVVFYSLEPLSIIEDSLPSGVVGRIYSASLKTTNGANQVTWTATGLPAGLKMESYRFSGSISGRPTEKGIFPVVVSAVDGMGGTAEKSFELIIEAPALSITTASLPNGDTQEEYSTVLSATGGFGELIWSTTGLPSGLSCSSSGTISGTPAQSGTFIVVATVTDSLETSAVATFSLVIDEPSPPLAISTDATLPDGLVLQAYEVTLEATGGTEPYAWNVSEPSELPSGLSLSAAGVLSGTPTAAGSYSFCVFVSSADGQTASKTVSLDVTPAPLAIVTDATLPVALTEEWYWLPVVATGGVEPYTWEIVDANDWPEWLSSDYINYWEDWGYDCPYLSGTPYEGNIGTYTFALRVTDAEGTSVERTFTLEVQENPNHAPVIESWSPEATRFRIDPGATTNLSVVATDPDGDELTYSWTIYDENWNWLENGDSTSASCAFSHAAGEEGTNIVEVCVSDGSRAAYHTWTVVVAEKTPLAIVTDATLPVALTDASYWQPLEATGGEEPYAWEIADEDDLPGWLSSYYIDEYGTLQGWPNEDDIGTYTFALRVTDAEGTSVERTFALEVVENPNHAPVIESRSPEAYSVAIREGATALFAIEASDPDGDAIEISWSLYGGDGDWIADLATNAQGQVEVSPSEGVYQVAAYASDGSKDSYASWNVTVVSADAPMIDTDLPHAVEGVYYETLLAATGGTAPYTWSANYWAVELSEDGLLVFDTDGWDFEGDFTTSDFDVTVTDAAGRSTTQTLTLVIERNPNERPVIDSISPEGWDFDTEGITPIGASIVFSVEAHDPEGEPLAFEWRLDEEVLGETGDTWSWTPGRADRGHRQLSVHCSDGERESWWRSWYFEVVSTNVLSASVELPVAVVGTPYSAAFAVSGGTEPYVWGGPEYAMSREANSFAETGVAQDWSEDDGCWSVSLPFSFPFYGETYDTVWISDNGTICLDGEFSEWEFSEDDFKAHALIAPLWADMDGSIQAIYVDTSVSGQVAIRWAAHYYDDGTDDPVVAFSATLYSDGTIRYAYGDEAQAGAVGISAGDGARFLLPDEFQGADFGNETDVVFRPATFAPGLTLSKDGIVSGTPTTAGTYRLPVTVVDDEGASWSGTADLYVIEANAAVTRTTPVPVPHSWLLGHGLGDGTASGYETAAWADAANGRPVWACYVADLDPTDSDADLVAGIEMVDGEPEITILRGESPDRVYETQGAPAPGGPWGLRTKDSRFFRIKANLPE